MVCLRAFKSTAAGLRCSLIGALALFGPLHSVMAQPIAIAVSRSSLSLPLYVADAQRHFAAEGLAVTLQECIGGPRCFQSLLQGQVPLATVAELSVMFASFERSDHVILGTFATANNDVKLLTRRSSGLQSASQLAGKRIGTVKGSGAHYFLDSALLFHGVDPKRIELVLLPPEQVGPALLEGRIDAAAIWEPFGQQILRKLGADGLQLPTPRIYTLTFNLVASRSFALERSADLPKLLRALARAQTFIDEQPAQAQALLRTRLQEDQAYIDATWKDFDYRLSLEQSLLSTLEGQARWAMREGHVPAASRVANFMRVIEIAPLQAVAPAAVTLHK